VGWDSSGTRSSSAPTTFERLYQFAASCPSRPLPQVGQHGMRQQFRRLDIRASANRNQSAIVRYRRIRPGRKRPGLCSNAHRGPGDSRTGKHVCSGAKTLWVAEFQRCATRRLITAPSAFVYHRTGDNSDYHDTFSAHPLFRRSLMRIHALAVHADVWNHRAACTTGMVAATSSDAFAADQPQADRDSRAES